MCFFVILEARVPILEAFLVILEARAPILETRGPILRILGIVVILGTFWPRKSSPFLRSFWHKIL